MSNEADELVRRVHQLADAEQAAEDARRKHPGPWGTRWADIVLRNAQALRDNAVAGQQGGNLTECVCGADGGSAHYHLDLLPARKARSA